MFENDIELYYIGLVGNDIKRVSFEKPKQSNDSDPIRIPPASPSVTIDFFKAPYEERVKALQSQTIFYGSKDSIRQSLH